MLGRFVHDSLPSHIVFGNGVLPQLPLEAEKLGMERVLVLSTPEQATAAEHVSELLKSRSVGCFPGARMHTPTDVTEAACEQVRSLECDGVVAIGGGSTTGLAKAIALRTDLPQIIIPTTYAGSEVTPILGETENGEKITQRALKVLPETVIYDVDLTVNMPMPLTVTSGLNAIAHAAEAMYAPQVSPILSLIAQEGVRSLVSALKKLRTEPTSLEGRAEALYGAWLCGVCLGLVGMALHHKICHVLGGTFNLPHAETHSVVLPHSLAFNLAAHADARNRLSEAVGHEDPAIGLFELALDLGAPSSLRDIGMPQDSLQKAAKLGVARPYPNPRHFDESDLSGLLQRAWAGERPSAGE